MLTDEEIIKIAADTKTGEPGLHGYILPISFAREIERAVLAKAMPIPKQEPDLFVKFDANGEFVTARRNYKGMVFDCDASYVAYYRDPVPAQAAAIPDKKNFACLTDYDDGYEKGWNDCVATMLSASPKPE